MENNGLVILSVFLAAVFFALAVIFGFFWRRALAAASQIQSLANQAQADAQAHLLRKSQLESEKQEMHSSVALLRQERDSYLERAARAEADVKNLQERIEQEREIIVQAKTQLADSFKALAANALEGNSKQFMELAKSALSKESESAKMDLEKRQTAIDSLLKPMQEVLKQYQTQAADMERERQRSYSQVEIELKRVVEASQSLSQQTGALKDALKRPHVRGRWGEVQLKNCIELSGMSEYADVHFQDANTTDEGKRLIPDMTVRMPGGRIVVVDAKTPLDAFILSLEATSDEVRLTEMTRHGRQVKEHVKSLSTKAYNENLKNSADFTVMFLPNESFLYAALETQPDLVEFALAKKILLATPPTLIGLLKVIRYGWNEEKLAQNAQLISEVGAKLHKRLVEFADALEGMGKHLDKARDEYDTGLKRFRSGVLPTAIRLEALGSKSNKEFSAEMLNAPAAD